MKSSSFDVAIIGTGIVGIATAYYLAKNHSCTNITLIDCNHPMSFTSAQSGENYRNWWPHPSMVAFTNKSIDLMESIALASDNMINMNRRGYVLATRKNTIEKIEEELHEGLGEDASSMLRYHESADSTHYKLATKPDWQNAPDGVDILLNKKLIRKAFPSYTHDIESVIHIRRGGDISGQQLGMYMLDYLKEHGAKRILGKVKSITQNVEYKLEVQTAGRTETVTAAKIVNAAGPFAKEIAAMLDVSLPVVNIFQQKIAFEDSKKVIPRNMPFSIDLDNQHIDWTDEEREAIREEPELHWITEKMPGAIHCRPDGGDNGSWLKLGWAYNEKPAQATWESPLDENFPEIVLRGATRLNPELRKYYAQLPRNLHHYGGWYTMTEENWPLIGSMQLEGAFMNCAYSGFGTMAACAGGELCAAWVADSGLPSYAENFSLARYKKAELMKALYDGKKGVL